MTLLFDSRQTSHKTGWHNIAIVGHDQLGMEPTKADVELATKITDHSLPVILNIEHWPLPEQMSKYIQVVDWWREFVPGARIGYYSMLPQRNYWAPIFDYQRINPQEVSAWRQINAALARGRNSHGQFTPRGLVDVVDFICPSLYTLYAHDDHLTKWWFVYAEANIKAAKEYQKQVYPFIWPRYHDSNTTDGLKYIGDDFLRRQIETCLDNADGCVIWDYSGHPDSVKVDTEVSKILKEFV